MKPFKGKKGVMTLYISLFFIVVIILILAVFIAPMGIKFTSEVYAAGEDIMLSANETIQSIQNETVRTEINDMMNEALDSAEFNIQVNTDFFQYSWVFVILLAGIITFMYARQIVVFQGGGGFV